MATPVPTKRDKVRTVAPKLVQLSEQVLFGDVWERSALSKRDRSLVTVAALITLRAGDSMRSHMERAVRNGVSKDELGEVITQLAFYAGWPAAMAAGVIASQIFDQDDVPTPKGGSK